MSATPEEELDTSQEEPFVIELTEDDVQTVLNSVKIIEERFNEDAEIRLNEDQLLIELTNLFYTDIADLENNRNLSKKNKRFLDLIAEAAGEKAPAPPLKDLKPIINAVRVILLTEDDEEIDPEYEEDNQVKMMFQSEYLRRFQEIANNKSQTVDQVLPQLYLWTRSWRGADGPSKGFKLKIGKAIDAIIAAGGEAARTRLTGATPPYFDGDECDVVGVVIESPSAVRKPTQERYRFSITEYFAALESFAVGDNVSVCLNDFFEDVGGLGDRCTHQARVIRVVPGQGLYIDAHRVAEIFVPYRKYCPVMIFRDNRNHFNKRDFHQHDVIEIIFDPTVPLAENVAFA
ncbi:hypothetical protein EBT25_17350, partial [bacterium]|nr:hypothetical protein [bacterium]